MSEGSANQTVFGHDVFVSYASQDAAVANSIVENLEQRGCKCMPTTIAFEKARQAAQRALKLNPDLAMAHARLGDIHRNYDWDWPAADRELKQALALALAPTDGNILFFASGQSLSMGRWDEAAKQANAALAQDPLNQPTYVNLSLDQEHRGRLEEAEAAARRGLEINPTGAFGHYILGDILLYRNQADAALTEFSRETVEAARRWPISP